MKNIRLLFTLSSFIVLLGFSSCDRANKTGLLVPKKASMVVHFDLKELGAKISWEELSKSSWMMKLSKVTSDTLFQNLFANPSASGINLESDHVFFIQRTGRNGYGVWSGLLADIPAFEKLVSALPSRSVAETEGEMKFLQTDRGSLLAWNNERYLFLSDIPMGRNDIIADTVRRAPVYTSESLKAIAVSIVNLEGEELLDSDKRFTSLIADKGDVHVWVNTAELSSGYLTGSLLAMTRINAVIENNVSASTIRFEDGKIVVDGKQYFGEEMESLIKDFSPDKIDADMIGRLPTEAVSVAGYFNFPPKGLKELAKITATEGMANGLLGQWGTSLDEFILANKGTIGFAITDFVFRSDSNSFTGSDGTTNYYRSEKPDFRFVAGIAINDRPAFDKLTGIAMTRLFSGDSSRPAPFKYQVSDKWFVTGSSEENIQAFIKAGNKPAWGDKLLGHNSGIYIDIKKTLENLQAMSTNVYDLQVRAMIEASTAFWSDAVMTLDNGDGYFSSKVEINLADKKSNSLQQLNIYFDRLARVREL